MIGIGVIGYGYWGPNLVRNFSEATGGYVKAVSDLSPERLKIVSQKYPNIRPTSDFHDLLSDPDIDAIVIATPVSTHHPLAMAAIQAGKHVFVEKPLAHTSHLAKELVQSADKAGLVLMVDHTFLYTGAVRTIHDIVKRGDIGDIYYYDSVRVNLGLFQHDVNVIWDLAVHDLAIMDFILPCYPTAVSATGVSHIEGKTENIAYITLFYENPMISHIHVNWLSPIKIRRTLIGGSKKMVVYDDLEPSEKVKIYDSGITLMNDPENIYQMRIGYRTGDMHAPKVDLSEALLLEANTFISCIKNNEKPINDGLSGLRVVRVLEAATKSIHRRGEIITLERDV